MSWSAAGCTLSNVMCVSAGLLLPAFGRKLRALQRRRNDKDRDLVQQVRFGLSLDGERGWHTRCLAARYGGQLAVYRDTVEAVTGVPVLETWMLLPVAGAALRGVAA